MKEATFFYSTGYFLTVSPESMMVMAKYAGNFFKFKIKKQVQINHS
jgi:hypothetical protein